MRRYSCPPTLSTIRKLYVLSGILKDNGASLLRNHVDGAHDKKSRYTRKHRCIHDTQPIGSVHPKIAPKHPVIVTRADGTSTRRMMPPRIVANKLLQLRIRLYLITRHLLFGDQLVILEILRNLPDKPYAFHNGIQVCAQNIASLFKISKVNKWHIARIC